MRMDQLFRLTVLLVVTILLILVTKQLTSYKSNKMMQGNQKQFSNQVKITVASYFGFFTGICSLLFGIAFASELTKFFGLTK